jgi:hypothetical protein
MAIWLNFWVFGNQSVWLILLPFQQGILKKAFNSTRLAYFIAFPARHFKKGF